MKDKNKKDKPEILFEKKLSVNNIGMYTADPFGSYTGRPIDRNEKPVQDADDL